MDLLRRWRWALAAAVLVAAYALAGFLLAPWLIERELPRMVRAQLAREATLGRAEVNPFALTLRLQDFALRDADGSRLAGFDELFVNLQSSSLLNRALTLGELRVVAPYLNVVRDRAGDINLLKLAPPEPAPPGPADEGLPRLIVRQLRIEQGAMDVTDQVPATAFRTRVGPFDVALDEFSTLPDTAGRHQLTVLLESGTRIAIGGELVLNPLRASGQITARGPALGVVHRYIRDQVGFDVAGGLTDMSTRFVLRGTADGGFDASLADFGLRLADVRLTAAAAPDFLAFTELRLTGGQLRWPAAELSLESARLVGLRVKARRRKDGMIDLAALLAPRAGAAPVAPTEAAPPAAGTAGPRVRVGEVALEDMAIELTDEVPASPASFVVSDLDLGLREVSNEPGARSPLQLSVVLGDGGSVTLAGEVGALPQFSLQGELVTEGVGLAQLQPYVSEVARVEIRGGTLGLEGAIASGSAETLSFEGDVRVRDLDTYDQVKKERLLAWRELGVDDLQFFLDGNRASVSRVRLERPFARILVARDQTTNIGDLLVEPAAAPAGAAPAAVASTPSSPAPPLAARVGRVVVRGGEVDFADLSLPLPFAARVRDFAGELTTIDTRSAAASRLKFEGRVDEYGLAQVEGRVRVSSPTDLADVAVTFRNIEMAPLSPYTVKFAGRRIAGGKISLDLRYQLEDRRMVGANKIVIDELELGEKVPHPEATDLPLGLAVALLKDANGRIDVDMPVSGSLDDPQFGIGSVLWKAFVNLVTRAVSAPFRMLGGLIGVESGDLGRIDFPAGRADLLPPEQEKLARVAEALAQRPTLAVQVPAVVDPAADAAVLRAQQVAALVEQGIAASGKPQSGRGLEKRTRKVVEDLFSVQFPGEDLGAVQERFRAPPPDDPGGRPRLDELAYLDELRGRLAAVQAVGRTELDALASARAEAIGAALAAAGRIAPERILPGERREVSAREGAWVGVEIGLAGAGD